MEYEIVRINDSTWRIENGGVRFFLLTGTEKALLIDTGMTIANAREIAESLTDLPVSLLNTHADMDHVAGNGAFDSFYMHPDEEGNYRKGGRTGEILPIHEGDILDLGERKLEIIHLPGHTPGSVAILDVMNRVLISGDPIQENGRIYMFGEHRNMKQYVECLDHLEKWAGQFDEIWPSHADIQVSPEIVSKLREGVQAVLDGKIPGKRISFHGREIVEYDLGFDTLLCDE